MSMTIRCDGCGEQADTDEKAAMYVGINPALGSGNGHACSPKCAEGVTRRIQEALERQKTQAVLGIGDSDG